MNRRAIEMVLHFGAGDANPFPGIPPDANLDPEAMEAGKVLMVEGIIAPVMGKPGSYTLTERGRVWHDMVIGTPMPVQVWGDPRGMTLTLPVTTTTQGNISPAPAVTMMQAPMPDLPEGFTPNITGIRPTELQGTDWIAVARRNGNIVESFVGQLGPWTIKNNGDDIIGWERAEAPKDEIVAPSKGPAKK